MQPSVSMMSVRVQWLILGLAHRKVGRVARTNECLRRHVSGDFNIFWRELIMFGAFRKFLEASAAAPEARDNSSVGLKKI